MAVPSGRRAGIEVCVYFGPYLSPAEVVRLDPNFVIFSLRVISSGPAHQAFSFVAVDDSAEIANRTSTAAALPR